MKNLQKNWHYKNFTIYEFEELESTNSQAFEMAQLNKISDREIILAHKQSQGRGRKNRNWQSPKGNLYFSLVLKQKILAEKISQLSFVAIVALRLAIEKILMLQKNNFSSVPNVQNKWPNDLVVDEKKVAGLLLESKIIEKFCDFVVIGIGVNISSNPTNTIFPATNLKDFGVEILPENLLKNFLDEFEKIFQNWQDFGFSKNGGSTRKLWLQNAYHLHQEITVKIDDEKPEETITGIFENLDEEGNLILKNGQKAYKISCADVS